MEERRKYIRVPEKAQISYSVLSTNKSGQYATSDISQGGIRFFVHHFIPKGSRLKVSITFSRTSITFEALVKMVWIREVPYSGAYEIGVKFLDVSPEAADYLMKYIKSFIYSM